jgi:parallel beta-helix repeat protein
MSSIGKSFALLFVALFLISVVSFQSATVKAQTRTLIVPTEYPTIADALGNATAGNTVLVKDGTYSTYMLSISVPLTLVGQDPQKTILLSSSGGYLFGMSWALDITVNDVTVENFTIIGTTHHAPEGNNAEWDGILLQTISGSGPQPSDCKIINNTVVNNEFTGISVSGDSKNNIVSGNDVTKNWGDGVDLSSSNSVISNNDVTENNGTGVSISSKNVTIKQNNISNNSGGLELGSYGLFNVYQNNITYNKGFCLQFGENCSNSAIYDNNIVSNRVGIDLLNFAAPLGIGNKVYSNNLVNNSINAFVEHTLSPLSYPPTPSSNGTDVVSWDNGKTGNYWSDYQSKYPNASEVDSSGIENTPYEIGANNTDYYPLAQPVNISTIAPTLPSVILPTAVIAVVIVLVIVIVALLIIRRHRKTAILKQ